MNHIPAVDVERVSAAYEVRVRAVLDGDFPAALHLADRLEPQRWALEWNLATWLGDAFGLDPVVALEISLSNVIGLASIRLGDDVADGEVPVTLGSLPTVEAGGRLQAEALAVYRRLFAPTSEFWAQVELRMSEWRDATADGGSANLLQMRGAPLKISAFAVCLLTGHRQQFDVVARCLDHALAGMVLYDSVIDWREDLAEDRWNPFVEAAGVSVRRRHPGPTRTSDVEVALMATDVVPNHFRQIVENLERAATLASGLGIRGLHSHLMQLAVQLDGEGDALAARYGELGARAQQVLFGKQPPLAA